MFFIGIIVALAAVASVAKLGLISLPHDFSPIHAAPAHIVRATGFQGCQLEFMTLQAGLYQYMLQNNLTTVPAVSQDAPTRDMTSPVPLYPIFAPNRQTKLAYGWNASGRVNEIAQVGLFAPAVGCAPSVNGH